MKFNSEKGLLTGLVYLGIALLMGSIFIIEYIHQSGNSGKNFMLILPVILLTWFWFGTSYSIENEYIKYQSGFLGGKIAIQDIRKIEMNKTLWVGYRPALATKGLIIHYGKFNLIYFSPVDKEKFVALLQTVNPAIEVKDANQNS